MMRRSTALNKGPAAGPGASWPRGRLGLAAILAQVRNRARGTRGNARLADVAAVQNQPMMRVLPEFRRDEFQKLVLHGSLRLAAGEARAIGDAEDMRVDGNGGLAECGVEHDVGRFASHPRQRLECLAGLRLLSAVLRDQCGTGGDDVLRLAVEEPDGLD